MEDFSYRPRIVDGIIERYKQFAGAIYLRGAKLCGKTTTAKKHAQTVYELARSKQREAFLAAYDFDFEAIFSQPKPILFDEWQECPFLWDDVRSEVDAHHGTGGQFLLTGSREMTEEENEQVRHSGTGRIYDLVMRPMSLYESGESDGTISLISLFDPSTRLSNIKSTLSKDDLVYATCRGGWPAAVEIKDREIALKVSEGIVDNCINGRDFAKRKKQPPLDPELVRLFLHAYSRPLSSIVGDEKIKADIRAANYPLTDYLYNKCKHFLLDLYLLEETKAWCPAFRSRSNLITSSKIGFVDPSLAAASLHTSPNALLERPIDYGFFFESLCMRELRIYSSAHLGRLCHYRDRYGVEADAVLILGDDRYALVECKLGFSSALKGAENLLNIKSQIEAHNAQVDDKSHLMKPPSALIVLHAGEEALTYKGGVHIVPIGCLKD